MRCTNCGIIIPYDKAPELTECALCGRTLRPDIRDILELGKYNIAQEVRPTQVMLGQDIEHVLTKPGHTLMAEGGTGIGKSFAYLIPALLEDKKRIIVSTAKKTLQDQLARKDIPFLVKQMGLSKLSFSLYKGKSNYACWKLAREVPVANRRTFEHFISTARGAQKPADIADWKGDTPMWWSKISIDNCVLGNKCPFFKTCKPHPRESNLIVTNHHLMAIDTRTVPGMLFGKYDILIIDEAHQAGEAFRSAHSRSVTSRGIEILEGMLDNDENLRGVINDTGIISALEITKQIKKIGTTFGKLHNFAKRHSDQTGAWDIHHAQTEVSEFRDVGESVAAKLFIMQEHLSREYDNGAEDPDFLLTMMGRMQRIHKRVVNIVVFASDVLTDIEKSLQNTTYRSPNLNVQDDRGLQLQPLDIGNLVGPPLRIIPHKIILSATLAIGNDFTFTKKKFGIRTVREHTLDIDNNPTVLEPDAVTEKIYPSPFDLKTQAIMYIPRHLPLAAHPGNPEARTIWIRAVATELAQLFGATKGDAFVLFTAKADMNEILEDLGDTYWKTVGLNLVKHDGDATAALEQFKEIPNSVLFGLKSFWEGIDVTGDKLKMVIIPKLPFPNPKDPLIAALCDKAGSQSFREIMLPHMFFDMKQGVGRLIRTQKDRGFIVILDPRVWSGTGNKTHEARMNKIANDPHRQRMGYGKQLLDMLGYTQITDDFTILQRSVKNFFK